MARRSRPRSIARLRNHPKKSNANLAEDRVKAKADYRAMARKSKAPNHTTVTDEFDKALCEHKAQMNASAVSFKPGRSSRGLPDLLIAQTGEPVPQHVAVDMEGTAPSA